MARKAPVREFSAGKLIKLRGEMTYSELAFQIRTKTGVNVSSDSIRKYEVDANPTSEKLAAIAGYFGITIDDLFE